MEYFTCVRKVVGALFFLVVFSIISTMKTYSISGWRPFTSAWCVFLSIFPLFFVPTWTFVAYRIAFNYCAYYQIRILYNYKNISISLGILSYPCFTFCHFFPIIDIIFINTIGVLYYLHPANCHLNIVTA